MPAGVMLSRTRRSAFSPLSRVTVLPPHHPGRLTASSTFPYHLVDSVTAPSQPVVLAGRRMQAVVDVGSGGRLVALSAPGAESPHGLRAVQAPEFGGGIGLRGGVEWNPTPLARSPFGVDTLYAATDLPERLGPRLRMWEYDRARGWTFEIDLHLCDDLAALVVLVRQRRLAGSAAPAFATLADDESVTASPSWQTVGSFGGVQHAAGPLSESGDLVERWQVWVCSGCPAPDDHALANALLAARGGLSDTPTTTIADGGHWGAADLALRTDTDGFAGMFTNVLTERSIARWHHLLVDEGLGTADRVNPSDPGEAAGPAWLPLLERARRRESLGDWRVHLHLGEYAFLAGDLDEAKARWEWSDALRPTVWAERNLALADATAGRLAAAPVRYLRAHRRDPGELTLAVESVGTLIASGRTPDARTILKRAAGTEHAGSAVLWLLEAEVALASGTPAAALVALGHAAAADGDVAVHDAWLSAVRAAC